jgi:citrate synthase
MHMSGTGMENEVEICATNITNKTKCKSIIEKKWKKTVRHVVSTTSAICGVKPEHSRLKIYGQTLQNLHCKVSVHTTMYLRITDHRHPRLIGETQRSCEWADLFSKHTITRESQ